MFCICYITHILWFVGFSDITVFFWILLLVLNIIECNNSLGIRHTVEPRITVTLLIRSPHNLGRVTIAPNDFHNSNVYEICLPNKITSLFGSLWYSHEGNFYNDVPLCQSPMQTVTSAVFIAHCRKELAAMRDDMMDALEKQVRTSPGRWVGGQVAFVIASRWTVRSGQVDTPDSQSIKCCCQHSYND